MTAAWPVLVLVGVLGLAVGSFLNVVIYRVPRGQSLVSPGSRCPRCDAAIKARHNVPVIGWLVLRGRCASCAAPISPRYPLVEAATAAVMVLVTARFGLTIALPAYLFFVAAAITLATVDADLRRIPDTLVLPAYLSAALLLVPVAAADANWIPAARTVLGVGALCAVFFAMQVAFPIVFTGADVKLAGFVGMYLGWLSWSALAIGSAVAVMIGVAAIAAAAITRRHLSNVGCDTTAPALSAPHPRSTPCPH